MSHSSKPTVRTRLAQGVLFLIGLLIVVAVFFRLTSKPASPATYLATLPKRPIVMAHMCGDNVWPGDTLFACQKAVELGVDVLDLDFQLTTDGQLVLIHDETLERTSNGTGRVDQHSLAELKALDAAYNWSNDGGQTFPYRGQGLTFTTVEEVFQAFPEMHLNIEIKPENEKAAQVFCDLIKQYEMQDKVMVASFADVQMQAFRRACPAVATAATQNEMIVFFALQTFFLGDTYSPAFQTVQVPEQRFGLTILTPGFITNSHHRNLEAHVWTINERADMERLLAMGVDGINTDRPDLLMEVLDR
jgi:glycerophosphoryl diester phosphodiesterase